MKKIGTFILSIAVALYLFVNGILGFNKDGTFHNMANTILSGDIANIVAIILSVLAIVAGVFLLLQLFKVIVPYTDTILFVFVIVWVIYIVIVDIINPLGARNFQILPYITQLSTHLMVLGALITSTKKFN
jgi:hypothetical protein